MESKMSRRGFLTALGLAGLGAPTDWPGNERRGVRGGREGAPDPSTAPAFPRHDLARVQSVVAASHGDFDRVRELVEEQPALAKASWDWGFGDWETPLGAASHTGRRDIADFLVAHGARPTIFSAAMMGDLPTVEAFLNANPGLHLLHGPHGISLVRHARVGGEDARPVLDFLLDRFGPDEIAFGFAGDQAVEERYGGFYRFDMDPPLRIIVGVRNEWLMVGTGDVPTARLIRISGDDFHPSGATAVRFRFVVEGGRATALEIEDGPVSVRGARISGRPTPAHPPGVTR